MPEETIGQRYLRIKEEQENARLAQECGFTNPDQVTRYLYLKSLPRENWPDALKVFYERRAGEQLRWTLGFSTVTLAEFVKTETGLAVR